MTNDNIPSEVITYALAHCEAKIAEIAGDSEQPESQLREWVGTLLLTKGTGLVYNMSSLRGSSPKISKRLRTLEMAKRSYRKTSRTPVKRIAKSITKGPTSKGFKYNGTHWTQQSKNRAKLRKVVKARVAAWETKAKAKAKANGATT